MLNSLHSLKLDQHLRNNSGISIHNDNSNHMNNQCINLFIIDDNPLVVTGLRNFLNKKFGSSIKISTFFTGESALKLVDKNTGIVILDYYLKGENGNEILASIKELNPKTEVIMLTSNENVSDAIEAFRRGASDYLIKGESAWKKVARHVYKTITDPILKMGKEFGLSKFLVIFLTTFIFVGLLVLLILKLLPAI